ncbi:MAG TPA: hypothetical protein VE684_01585 [Crenalkalicoccus sp.]|nr:hypothetical protein [Crenalkalicoccus sp.]
MNLATRVSDPGLAADRRPGRWALPVVLAGLLGLLPALVQLWRGVPLQELNSGGDADFALNTLQVFLQEIGWGHLPPRWAAGDHDGFGSPIFYYYAPLPWLVAAPFVALGLPPDGALVAALALSRLAAFAGCLVWLRMLLRDAWLVAAGAALFVLAPYIAVNLAMQRFAFSECLAVAFVPVCFIAADRPGPAVPRVLLGALGFAALAITHLPTTIIAALMVPAYALLVHGPRRLLEVLAGGMLGALLSALWLVPALRLQDWAAAEWWLNSWLSIGVHALFGPANLTYLRVLWDLGNKLVEHAAWLLDAAILWLLARHWPGLSRRERAICLVLGLALLLMAWPFALVLAPIPVVQNIEFPWRALGTTAILVAAAAALAAARQPRLRPWLAGLLLVLSLGPAALAMADHLLPRGTWLGRRWMLPQFAESSTARLAAVTRGSRPEFVTRWGDRAGWPPGRPADQTKLLGGMNSRSGLPLYGTPAVLQGSATLDFARERGRIVFAGRVESAGGAVVRLPQLFWPAFRSTQGSLSPDPSTGLTLLTLPAGGAIAGRLVLETTWPERLGLAVSGLGLALWLGGLGWAVAGARVRRGERRPVPSAGADPVQAESPERVKML